MRAYLELYIVFLKIGLFTHGGGYALIPLIQEEIVAKREWLTPHVLADIISVAEVTPGPFALNAATFIGMTQYGIPGAVAATLGFITIPALITMILCRMLFSGNKSPAALKTFATLRPVTAGIIASAAAGLAYSAVTESASVINAALMVIYVLLLIKHKPSPVLVILSAGIAGVLLF